MPVKIVLYTDLTAALGISRREGVGRLRHLDLRPLWLQDGLREQLYEIKKVGTRTNIAGIGPKALVSSAIAQH
eukprot:2312120-Amphidinium_carterae.1